MIIKRRVSLKATQKHHVKIWMIDFAPPSRQHLTCNNGMKHGLRTYDDYISNKKFSKMYESLSFLKKNGLVMQSHGHTVTKFEQTVLPKIY